MSKLTSTISCGALLFCTALATGCSTTSHQSEHQFTPIPVAKIGSQDIGPAKERSATELLSAADAAFRKANAAQESGDQKLALRHYREMLDLLAQADLNPAAFYNLRAEFERVLDSTSETADLFERDRPGFELGPNDRSGVLFSGSDVLKERVRAEIEEIQQRYPKNFQAGLDRSAKYLPYIQQEFAKAGLPKDLVWLAMVESQFHPDVTSRAGAVGMWQFMKATGQRYGLQVDNYVDERRNWEKATVAAAKYLSALYDMHGSWALAVSSYNMGEAGIARAVAMNGGEKDIWRLIEIPPASDHIPTETKKFYPRLLASVIVAQSPERYGFRRNPLPPDSTVRVPIRGSYSIAALERASSLPSGTLKKLNPDLVRGVTPPDREHLLAIPADSQTQLLAALEGLAKEPQRRTVLASSSDGRTHTVRRGETLASIARRYDTSVEALATENHVRSATRLPVGKRLVIPGGAPEKARQSESGPIPAAKEPPAVTPPAESKPVESAEGPVRTYRVKRGDTLYTIAKAHNVSLSELLKRNNLDANARIRVNDEIVISGHGVSPSGNDKTRVHTVRPGEFPATIAKQYGVKVDDLLEWNKLTKKSIIRVGDELLIYGGEANVAASRSNPAEETVKPTSTASEPLSVEAAGPVEFSTEVTTHTVANGETLGGIASKYGVKLNDLLAENGLDKSAVLRIGQKLKVRGAGGGSTRQPATEMAKATSSVASAAKPEPEKAAGVTLYKVVQGDTLSAIATKHKVKMADLRAWNKLADDAVLRIGQELIVSTPEVGRKQEEAATAQAPKATVHTVAAGENPTSIARKYGVAVKQLLDWNKWTPDHVLHIGDKVIVYTGTH
ncbi:MAG: hypothetical protein AMXMBFR4_31830 [Candidatus Hydrogenedentota bacterium]